MALDDTQCGKNKLREYVIIFVLLLMPLQAVWASVNSYCQHEESAGADHFGHHEHRHAAAGPGEGEDGHGIARMVDADCDYCHHATSNLMTVAAQAAHFPFRMAPQPAAEPLYRSFIPDITHPPDI